MAENAKDGKEFKMNQETRDFLNRVRGFVINNKPLLDGDLDWQGAVQVNKDIILRITGKDGRFKKLLIPANSGKENEINFKILQKLVLQAIQEGNEEMRKDFFANTGSGRSENPLKVVITKSHKTLSYEIDKKVQKSNFPSFNE